MIRLERTTGDAGDFKRLTEKLDLELKKIYGSSQEEFDQYNIMSGIDTVVLAYADQQPAGCGCFKKAGNDTVELKRMYVEMDWRGKGIGALILEELERWASELGYQSIILETGTIQPDAIRLYKKHGFEITPNFAPYLGNELSVCFKKTIA